MNENEIISPPDESKPQEEQLFGYGPGSYSDTYRPLSHERIADSGNTTVTPPEVKKLLEMSPDEMIEVALMDRLVPDIYGQYNEKRGDFIKVYNWTPYSEGELTAAIGSLPNYLLGANEKGGLSAVRNVVNNIYRYRGQSVVAIETLREAQALDTEEFQPSAARTNLNVRQELARSILARNSLNLFEWPRQFDKKTKETKENQKTRGALMTLTERLATLEYEKLTTLLQKAIVHHRARLSFWTEQSEQTEANEKTGDLFRTARSNG